MAAPYQSQLISTSRKLKTNLTYAFFAFLDGFYTTLCLRKQSSTCPNAKATRLQTINWPSYLLYVCKQWKYIGHIPFFPNWKFYLQWCSKWWFILHCYVLFPARKIVSFFFGSSKNPRTTSFFANAWWTTPGPQDLLASNVRNACRCLDGKMPVSLHWVCCVIVQSETLPIIKCYK